MIDATFSRSRTTLLLLAFLFVAGVFAYLDIPKEAEPDVSIPNVYVTVTHDGISPGDAERLLIRPLEQELQSIEGLRELRATAAEGYASVMLEFDAGFDPEQALRDVREQVDIARAELPADSDEPRVQEINVALFPVLTAVLSGPVPETTLVDVARDLKDRIEGLAGVLEVDIGGDREEVVNVVVDPTVMETYRLSYSDLFGFVENNNQLVAAGSIDTGSGRFAVKVPGVIENLDDVMQMPVKVDGDRVITVRDIATIDYTFKDPEGFARVDGVPALSLEVKKRLGANIIETVEEVRSLVAAASADWPDEIGVEYLQDKSEGVRTTLRDLQNNIVTAVLLVMLVIILSLGLRPALLVGVAIPGSFLVGILVMQAMGLTLNIVSLFSLILVVGMLVDGAIVVVELADRNLAQGMSPVAAYSSAAKRMCWPIIASTATTLAVFFPLLFWPGMVGEFMKYLPITVIACLAASLAMALVFVPVLGAAVSAGGSASPVTESLDGPLTGAYLRMLEWALARPGKVLAMALLGVVIAYGLFGALGRGTEFFPEQEPDYAQVHVRARGDLSIIERDALVQKVEERLIGMPEIASVYSRTLGGDTGGAEIAADVIGNVQLKFVDWQERRPVTEVLKEVRDRTASVPGVIIEARTESGGPSTGKPVVLEISGNRPEALDSGADAVRDLMAELGGFVDVEDDRPLPGSEWRIDVDRAEAARYGASVAMLGNVVKLVTNGIKLTEYRPEHADEEVDIRLRFADADRHLGELDQLRVNTGNGTVPISNFVRVSPAKKTGTLRRLDGERVLTLKSDVEEGLLVSERIAALRSALQDRPLPDGIAVDFAGQDEDQEEAMTFLVNAFLAAIALMTIFLVTQFNSIYQAALVLSAIVFSTAGILIGLLVTNQPFGIVMCGIGVIALAGIVVNNNIILIDTYNSFRNEGLDAVKAAVRTGALRVRPVVLTALTTVLGLLPMVFAINPDFVAQEITIGAPSTQLWTQLASSIAGGLSVATLLTLVLTPCLLILGERAGNRVRRVRARMRSSLQSATRGREAVPGREVRAD